MEHDIVCSACIYKDAAAAKLYTAAAQEVAILCEHKVFQWYRLH